WALSAKFDHGRHLLGKYCWMGVSTGVNSIKTATFETREQAREAQKTCCYKKTRVEHVQVTVRIVE
ncbi:unnamed protein product, partial [marine sediment metagenome]